MDPFEEEMRTYFDAVLRARPLRNVGRAATFNFDIVLKGLRIWDTIPTKEAAVFSQDSRNWGQVLVRMMNDTNQGLLSGEQLQSVQKTMGMLIREMRPDLDALWESYRQSSDVDPALMESAYLPANFMGFCREIYIRRLGCKVRGSFQDLFAIYKEGYLPCGWDGDFPDGELLIY